MPNLQLSPSEAAKAQFILAYVTNSFEYAKKAAQDGYYVEAIARLDIFIDALLELLLRLSCKTGEEEEMLDAFEKVIGHSVTKKAHLVLVERGALTPQLAKRIEKFKERRNTLLHDLLGPLTLIEKQYADKKLDAKSYMKEEKALLASSYEEGIAILGELLKLIQPKMPHARL